MGRVRRVGIVGTMAGLHTGLFSRLKPAMLTTYTSAPQPVAATTQLDE
jgi:hypothetical protein